MLSRTFALVALLSLVSCAATGNKPAAPRNDASPASSVFLYRASVASAKPGSKFVLHVSLPSTGPAAEAKFLGAYGLVGNAPFDFSSVGRGDAHPVEVGAAKLSCKGERDLSVETAGKPVEFSLRFELPGGAPIEASALEKELVRGTSATADGQPIEALVTRLERVR